MQEAPTKSLTNRPCWVDLAADDAGAARDFYTGLFGWQIDVSPDPQYGGYAMATRDNIGIAGIGGKQDPNAPSAWTLYIGTDDVDALTDKVKQAGGSVAYGPADVGDQGRFAVLQDPSGAFFSAWQATQMRSFIVDEPNAFGWAELNARGVEDAIPFYEKVFGWARKTSDSADGQPPYTEFLKDGESIAGAWEMSPMVPAQVPSYWQIYFNVADVDAAFDKAIALGATEMLAPQDFPGGRFSIVGDPAGASFGLLRTTLR
jgi:predicted enzyme related to lactoylglutathione lyase